MPSFQTINISEHETNIVNSSNWNGGLLWKNVYNSISKQMLAGEDLCQSKPWKKYIESASKLFHYKV